MRLFAVRQVTSVIPQRPFFLSSARRTAKAKSLPSAVLCRPPLSANWPNGPPQEAQVGATCPLCRLPPTAKGSLPSTADGKEPALPLFCSIFLISNNYHNKYFTAHIYPSHSSIYPYILQYAKFLHSKPAEYKCIKGKNRKKQAIHHRKLASVK